MVMTRLNWHKSRLREKRKRRSASREPVQQRTTMTFGPLRVGHLFDRGNTVAAVVGLSGRRNF